ncbi:4-hydroxy-3-methylbut-2-en-1-yl diphosphate synthase [Roseovarius sp. HI0049]|nr:4-hydroxy-3-methylbut-2-en-1-yl diphosphate synthase [Roseovarius sp. HI0049]
MAIRRSKTADPLVNAEKPRGFDAYDVRLGDKMRGERATLGKSLLDVEREIRIRASYIAAIENADPDAFDTPGFIPGYVRSYARYLGMDPDAAFADFCAECGFSVAHGMSAGASSIRKPDEKPRRKAAPKDPLIAPSTPFLPARETMFSQIEPGAIGSALVLVALIAGIGYGGWAVLNEIQRVQFAPVENTPDVLTDLDPLDAAVKTPAQSEDPTRSAGVLPPVSEEGLDRPYRPEALDVPVMVARDAPISTLNPADVGTFVAELPDADRQSDPVDRNAIENAIASAVEGVEEGVGEQVPVIAAAANTPKVVADPPPGVRLVAVRPAWVRVRAADGSVVYEGILNGGDTYSVPVTEEPPTLRVGESGAVYFEVAGKHYGPVGPNGSVTSDLALAAEGLTQRYDVADLSQDRDLSRYVAQLEQVDASPQE